MGDLTRNFSLSEFKCTDGSPVPSRFLGNVKELAKNLQKLRDALGRPIHITSGYRTKSYNSKIGGAPSSKHMLAQAADIQIPGLTPRVVGDAIEALIHDGVMVQGGLGRYSGWIHYDVRGDRARWRG